MTRVRETRPDGPSGRGNRSTACPRAPNAGRPAEQGGFYHPVRRQSAGTADRNGVFLAPYDPDFDAERPADAVLSVDALCTNRDLPADLPFGGTRPDGPGTDPADEAIRA